jgi:hypothetical protein
MAIRGESGDLHDMSHLEGADLRELIQEVMRGHIKDACYNVEERVLDSGRRKVYIELHLEVE